MLRSLTQRLFGVSDKAPRQGRRRASRRAPQRRPRFEALEDRELLSLSAVSNTTAFPYRSIVELKMTFPNNKVYVGSGAMIDRFHVLTAGHVVYSYADGGWAKQIEVTPAMNGTSKPFGTAYATYQRTFTTWTNFSKQRPGQTASNACDIAMLTLNRTIGDYTGWMGYGTNTDSFFSRGRVLNTAGYPAANGYSGTRMYASSGGITGLTSDKLGIAYAHSSITTYGGQSGSPLWAYTSSNASRVIYGVVAGGNSSTGFSTRITTSIFNTFQTWRNSDRVPTTRSVATAAPSSYGTLSTVGAMGTALTAFEGSVVGCALSTAGQESMDFAAVVAMGGHAGVQLTTATVDASTASLPAAPLANPAKANDAAIAQFKSEDALAIDAEVVATANSSAPKAADARGTVHESALASLLEENTRGTTSTSDDLATLCSVSLSDELKRDRALAMLV